MITDTLQNAALYEALHPGFKPAFDFLRNNDLSALVPDIYEIDGRNIYAMVQEYDTKPLAEGKWEAHRSYIDIQYIIEGEELLGDVPTGRLSPMVPYSAEKDIEFLTGEGSLVTLCREDFMILYPHDAHMPGIAVQQKSAKVRKVVLKIRV